jgi:hypothetical protein
VKAEEEEEEVKLSNDIGKDRRQPVQELNRVPPEYKSRLFELHQATCGKRLQIRLEQGYHPFRQVDQIERHCLMCYKRRATHISLP